MEDFIEDNQTCHCYAVMCNDDNECICVQKRYLSLPNVSCAVLFFPNITKRPPFIATFIVYFNIFNIFSQLNN